jgi:hypothetical protein
MSDPIAVPGTPATSGPEMSTAETLTAIFFEPSRTFESLRARPRFLVAALIVFILTCLLSAVINARVDMGQFFRDRIEQSPRAAQTTVEQKELQARILKNAFMVGIPLTVPIGLLLGAALYLLLTLAFGGSITYKKSLSVWAYSWLPQSVLTTLIALLVLFLKSPDSIAPENLVATNPGALLGEDTSKVLVAFLKQFDLLRFYGMFLAALGLRKIAKMSSGQAWGVVLAVWLLFLLFSVGSTALSGR